MISNVANPWKILAPYLIYFKFYRPVFEYNMRLKLGQIEMAVNSVLETAMLFFLQNLHTFRRLGQANFKRLLKISLKILLAIWQKRNGIF